MFKNPMLCGLKKFDMVCNSPDWLWERKYDGERAQVEISSGKRFIFARSGKEKNRMYPDLQIDVRVDCTLDGEIATTTGKFNDIQHRVNRKNGIQEAAWRYPVMFHCFDVIQIAGQSVIDKPLSQRKAYLNSLIIPNPTCEIVPHYQDGITLWSIAQTGKWEGIIGKKVNSRYGFGERGESWIKVKVLQRETCWVVGYTPGTGWRQSTFGAMVLGKFQNGVDTVIPVGEVGTGFTQAEIARLDDKLKSSGTGIALFSYPGAITWIAQPFEIMIEFLEKTADGKYRFPSYKGTL